MSINPNDYYPIGKAAMLAGVDRHTLLRDAKNEFIPYRLSLKTGRKKFLGQDIINYIKHVL